MNLRHAAFMIQPRVCLSFHPLILEPWCHLLLQHVQPSPGSDPEHCLLSPCLLHQLTLFVSSKSKLTLYSATHKSGLVVGSVIYLSAISSLFHYVCFIFPRQKQQLVLLFLTLPCPIFSLKVKNGAEKAEWVFVFWSAWKEWGWGNRQASVQRTECGKKKKQLWEHWVRLELCRALCVCLQAIWGLHGETGIAGAFSSAAAY